MRQFFLRNTIFVIFPAVALGILLPVFVRASLYQPGETLNPDCPPGSPNCGVVIGVGFSQGGNSFGTAADLGTNDNYALNFRANSSTALTVLPSGDVGIGTTTPADKLDVNGGVRVVGNLEIGNFQPASSGNLQLFQGIGYYGIQSYNNWPLAINPLGNNVGIGTTTPQTKLSVVLSGSQYVNISGGNLVIQSSNSTGALIQVNSTGVADLLGLYDNNNPALVVKDGGYVGIGTSSPAQRLDVSGRRILLGSNVGDEGSSRTDGTGKIGSILFPNRLNSEEPIAGMILYSNTANRNDLYFGGGVENIPINAVTDIYFYTALNSTTLTGTERMRITSTGRIGIGTTSPVATLSIMGTSSAPTLDPFLVASSTGVNLFTVSSSGSVGVGIQNPQAKLQVAAGDILMSSSAATPAMPVVDSGSLVLRGAYWDGSQSVNSSSYLKNVILSNVTSSPNSQLEFYVAGDRVASLRNISNPPYPEPARDFRVYGATGVPAIFSLIAGNGTDYADYTYNGADADIDVSTGGLNLRPLSTGASVKVWNSADNVKLRVGSQNFAQSLDLFHDGSNAWLDSTTGSIIVNRQLIATSTIYSAKALAPTAGTLNTLVSADAKVLFYNNSLTNWSGMGTDDGGNTWLRTGTAGNNLFVFSAVGQLGVGVTTPSYTLDVGTGFTNAARYFTNGNNNTYITASGASGIEVDGGYLYANGATTSLYVQNGATFRGVLGDDTHPYLSITGGTSGYTYFSGNVGIGTSTPSQKLDVNGNIQGSGDVYLNRSDVSGPFIGATANAPLRLGANYAEHIRIMPNGNVGIGTTSPAQGLHIGSVAAGKNVQIANGWLCVDTNDTCTGAATAGTVYAVNAYTTGADVAENYPTTDVGLQPGDVVAVDINSSIHVVRASSTSPILGVISTKPGLLLNGYKTSEFANASTVPVALSGRVPVKVTNENGNIKVGDYLAPSKKFWGYAMKATEAGTVIGRALEPFNSQVSSDSGKILVFLQITYFQPHVSDLLQSASNFDDTAWMSQLVDLNMTDAALFNQLAVKDTLVVRRDLRVGGIIYATELKVDTITAKRICLDDVCLDSKQLKALLDNLKSQFNNQTVSNHTLVQDSNTAASSSDTMVNTEPETSDLTNSNSVVASPVIDIPVSPAPSVDTSSSEITASP